MSIENQTGKNRNEMVDQFPASSRIVSTGNWSQEYYMCIVLLVIKYTIPSDTQNINIAGIKRYLTGYQCNEQGRLNYNG